MQIIDTGKLAKEFGLSESIAREIVADETQRALRTRWQPWVWLATTLPLVGWYYVSTPPEGRLGPFFVLLGSMVTWLLIARYLAGPAIRVAAKNKADRLAGNYA